MEYLLKLKKHLEDITGYWNGEDDSYVGGDGEVYNEDDAHVAEEAIEKIEELIELLKELNIK